MACPQDGQPLQDTVKHMFQTCQTQCLAILMSLVEILLFYVVFLMSLFLGSTMLTGHVYTVTVQSFEWFLYRDRALERTIGIRFI